MMLGKRKEMTQNMTVIQSTSQSLPSIQWMLPFEAAARHLSFKRAAEELHVTPPAVSQQIKSLEHHLGIALFERKTRALSLTVAGVEFYKTAQQVLDVYEAGCHTLYRQYKQGAFYVATEPYIAHTLLIPNLMSFRQLSESPLLDSSSKNSLLSGCELRVETRLTMVGMNLDDMDAGIRFGHGDWPDMEAFPLADVTMVPVGSKSYFDQHRAAGLEDFNQHCFFYPSTQKMVLEPFLEALEKNGIAPKEVIPCESYLDAMTAASEGLGITVALLPYANRWINEGKLVMPFDMRWRTDAKFWVVYRKHYRDQEKMQFFCNWLSKIVDGLAA